MAPRGCRSLSSHLPVLVDQFGDPWGVRVSSVNFMEWISEDNLKESVCGILANLVRIQDSEGCTVAPSLLLCKIEGLGQTSAS